MNYRQALKYAMDLCSKRERCKTEIREKLLKNGLAENDIDKIISELEKENFLNEARYVRIYAGDKLRLNGWGRIKIRFMLYKKKIPEGLVDEALQEMNMDEYLEILKKELAKKNNALHTDNLNEKRNRLYQFALQRGFESDVIRKVIDSELI